MAETSETPPVAIFDLDRTITRIGTFTPLCLYAAWRHNPFRLLGLPLVMIILVLTGLKVTSRKTLKTWLLAILVGGRSRAEIARIVNDFIDLIWERQVRPAALEAIEEERLKGARLYLATASYDFCASAFTERLNFDGCIATRSLWRGDRLVPGIDGENCYGDEKLERITSYLTEEGLLVKDRRPNITMYSDDRSDLPALTWADRAVVVDPKPKFERIAKARALEIVNW